MIGVFGGYRAILLGVVLALTMASGPVALHAAEAKPEPGVTGVVTGAVKNLVEKVAGKKPKKAKPSPCRGLVQTACSAVTACRWVVFKKAADKKGRLLKPYCRLYTPLPKPKAKT